MIVPAKNAVLEDYPKGHIYQGYGENPALYMDAVKLPGHSGIDIAMSEGTPILAAHDGYVFKVKNDPAGYGEHIWLVSPKSATGTYISTIYGHNRNQIVQQGEQVFAGQQIAEMSNTGFVISGGSPYWGNAPVSKGVHLHFGMSFLTDPIPGTYQISVAGRGYTVIDGDGPMKGWVDPLLWYNIKNMEYIIIGNTQYLLYAEYKIAISIADFDELNKLHARGLKMLPEERAPAALHGYWIIPGIELSRMRDIFNL